MSRPGQTSMEGRFFSFITLRIKIMVEINPKELSKHARFFGSSE